MNKIMELRNKRNTLWEQTKNFLEEHRGENGLVEASAVEESDPAEPEDKELRPPVIGMDGKTEDGSMPYEILKDRLEWMR